MAQTVSFKLPHEAVMTIVKLYAMAKLVRNYRARLTTGSAKMFEDFKFELTGTITVHVDANGAKASEYRKRLFSSIEEQINVVSSSSFISGLTLTHLSFDNSVPSRMQIDTSHVSQLLVLAGIAEHDKKTFDTLVEIVKKELFKNSLVQPSHTFAKNNTFKYGFLNKEAIRRLESLRDQITIMEDGPVKLQLLDAMGKAMMAAEEHTKVVKGVIASLVEDPFKR